MSKGFKLLDRQYVKEEDAELLSYIHEKSGAKLFHLKNKDDNKLFAITFKTPPLGSTGNCHILEHSVLNGSRKYKSKEPFMDALKSSLQTFLNAATYPDKTMYPVASRNNKDFQNLMDLYLDAVFYPAVLEDERIFRQEGWRYEIFDKKDPIKYQGVVYSEMKGAMSSPESQLEQTLMANLYPDTIYAFNAGGDPAHIPDLSYEDFCNYHKKHYKPSNSMTFLYGDIGEEVFDHLDSYFSDFAYEKPIAAFKRPVKRQSPYSYQSTFSIGRGEEEDKHAYFSMGWILEDIRTDYGRYFYKLLDSILIDSENSPLRRRLLEELGAEEIYSSLMDFEDVAFAIIAKNVKAERIDDFEKIVMESLAQIVEKGLDQRVLEGALNDMEFNLREKEGVATKGILFADMAMTESLYGKDIRPIFHYEKQLEDLRKALKEGSMEAYIKEKLLDNPGRVRGLHLPKAGKNDEADKKTAQELAKYKESLSDKQIEDLIKKNKELRKRQDSKDSPEAKATIPTLTLDDLPESLDQIKTTIIKDKGDSYLLSPMTSGGISYLSMVFDIGDMEEEDLLYLLPLSELMGKLDTKNYSYQTYEIEEALNTGGIFTNIIPIKNDKDDSLSLKIIVSTKILTKDKLDKALDLMKEQMLETNFSDRDRIKEQLLILGSRLLRSIIFSGHSYALTRALSNIHDMTSLNEKLSGLDNYYFIKALTDNPDQAKINRLEEIYNKLFSKARRTVSIAGPEEDLNFIYEKSRNFLKNFRGDELISFNRPFRVRPKSEAFYMTSDVQYNALAMSLPNEPYHASAVLAENILSNIYLYNELRAKGGAYGQFARINKDSKLSMVSYRDSHVENSFRVYREAGAYLSQFKADKEDWNKLLIGAAGRMDMAMTDQQKAYKALIYYLMDRDSTYDNDRFKELKETKEKDIRRWGERILAGSDISICSLGSRSALEGAGKLFESIEPLERRN